MNEIRIDLKRAILVSARIRLAPETQSIRADAIDKIIEQNMLLLQKKEEGSTIKEIEENISVYIEDRIQLLTRREIERSLERLVQSNRVVQTGGGYPKKYKLIENVIEELSEIKKTTEKLITKVIFKLFKNTEEGHLVYGEAFIDCLCIIFSQLGEAYVRLLKGEVGPDVFLNLPTIFRAFQEIEKKYLNINCQLFEKSIIQFFSENDPDYNCIKWNLAQNYYIVKAIGLDENGYLLSKEIFENACFYLDTNVIIDALEPKTQYHRSFKNLSKAFNSLNIKIKVAQISLNELRRVVDHHKSLILKVLPQIPKATESKIPNIFFQLFLEAKRDKADLDINSIYSSFEKPKNKLSKLYDIEVIDYIWFINNEKSQETKNINCCLKNLSLI